MFRNRTRFFLFIDSQGLTLYCEPEKGNGKIQRFEVPLKHDAFTSHTRRVPIKLFCRHFFTDSRESMTLKKKRIIHQNLNDS